jgi:hypothetical protein
MATASRRAVSVWDIEEVLSRRVRFFPLQLQLIYFLQCRSPVSILMACCVLYNHLLTTLCELLGNQDYSSEHFWEKGLPKACRILWLVLEHRELIVSPLSECYSWVRGFQPAPSEQFLVYFTELKELYYESVASKLTTSQLETPTELLFLCILHPTGHITVLPFSHVFCLLRTRTF